MPFINSLHLAKHVGELSVVPLHHAAIHLTFFRNAAPRVNSVIILRFPAGIFVVGQCVPSASYSIHEIEISIALSVIKHQRSDPSGSGPKTEYH